MFRKINKQIFFHESHRICFIINYYLTLSHRSLKCLLIQRDTCIEEFFNCRQIFLQVFSQLFVRVDYRQILRPQVLNIN